MPPDGRTHAFTVAAASRRTASARSRSTISPAVVPGHGDLRTLGLHFDTFRYSPAGLRIVVDVSPLSHPRTGIGNYIRGMLHGLVEAGADDVVAFAPASERGARTSRRRSTACRSSGTSARCRSPTAGARRGRRVRRPHLERIVGDFDVFHLSDWLHVPQRAGVRAR